MLDPSAPWLASGYKKFLPQDFCSNHSSFKSNSLDDFNYSPPSPAKQVTRQRRVRSAVASGRYRQQPKPPVIQKNTFYRPKSASHINQYRENPGNVYNHRDDGAGDDNNTGYRLPRRAKSASSHMRHRPTASQNKSVTEVERLHHTRLTVSSIPVGRTTDHKPCAYCPVECRPKSSSSQRPTSSTGLLAADVPSHFDRSKFWAKGTTRPRTAPTSRREFLHLPRHNYIQRGTVPHYTHFIRGLNLFPRDGSPLPHPAPPKLLVEKDGDPSASALFGGSSMVGDDDDTLGCSPSDLDDSDWEDVEDEGDAEDEGDVEDECVLEAKQEDITPVEDGNDQKAVQETPEKTVSEETITTPLPLLIVQDGPEEDVDEELERLAKQDDVQEEDEKALPPAPSPSPVTIKPEDVVLATDEDIITDQESGLIVESNTGDDNENQSEDDPKRISIPEPSESTKFEQSSISSAKGEEEIKPEMKPLVEERSIVEEKPGEEERGGKADSGKPKGKEVRLKLSAEVEGLEPSVTVIPTPPVKQQNSPSTQQTKVRREKKEKRGKEKKKEVWIQEPNGTKPFKPGAAERGEDGTDELKSRDVMDPSINKTLTKDDGVPATPQIILPGQDQEINSDERLSAVPLTDLTDTASGEGKMPEDAGEDQEPHSKVKLGPPPSKSKVDLLGMDSDEILDLEMRLRRKGSGSNLSDTEESLSDSIDSPNRKASKNRNFVPAPWNCCRVALSRRAGRFEMPMDMRDLVGMRPAEYLMKHCKVNPQRIALYRRTFSKVDKDCDGRINRKELNQAVTEALVDTVNEDQVASVLKSIGVGEDKSSMVKFSFFAPFCALLERLHYSMFVTEDSLDRDARLKDRIEDADFSALDWKLDGYEIDEDLKKLLYSL